MSDLTNLRDHARRILKGSHGPDCVRSSRVARYPCRWSRERSCPASHTHEPHEWIEKWQDMELEWICPGFCTGCLSDDERDLWHQIADEIEAYLVGDDQPLEGLS